MMIDYILATYHPAMMNLRIAPVPSRLPCTARAALLQPKRKATALQSIFKMESTKRAPAP